MHVSSGSKPLAQDWERGPPSLLFLGYYGRLALRNSLHINLCVDSPFGTRFSRVLSLDPAPERDPEKAKEVARKIERKYGKKNQIETATFTSMNLLKNYFLGFAARPEWVTRNVCQHSIDAL